jgi:hypothetical protein
MAEKRKAGRPKGTGGSPMSQQHRDKIRNSNILRNLIQHVEGEREMSSTQVTAGLGLLKKVMPDMTETMLKGDEAAPVVIKDTTNPAAKLATLLDGIASRTSGGSSE